MRQSTINAALRGFEARYEPSLSIKPSPPDVQRQECCLYLVEPLSEAIDDVREKAISRVERSSSGYA